ncbi:MAG: hypothetical protein QOE05_382 [Actinomycetota bacterium]|nr:hypothetical protein [Actinomycetota bacterium]
MTTNRRPSLPALIIAIAALALAVPSFASAASVAPTTVTGNPSCSDINSSWKELKVDRVPANRTYSDGTLSVTISNVQNDKTFDWTATQGIDAVLVKASTQTYVYSYSPEATSDSAMGSPGKWAISHVSFCYDAGDNPPPPNPTGSTDMDGDGVNDLCDNCGTAANPGQEDSDHDGMGDACEPTPTCEEAHAGEADSDGDGKVDACDNCPSVSNADQADADNDGMGDACEPTPAPQTCAELHAGEADTDGDGKVDACDNCPSVMNAGQEDTDQNGVGDACTTISSASQPGDQQVAGEQSAPAGSEPGGQLVLGERVAAPTARLIAASGCTKAAFSAGVRGTGIARVVFTVDGKRLATVTKRNAKGLYALRINPAKYRIGVHRIVVKVTFQANRAAAPRTLRAAFQRCSERLIAPRFTG